MVRALHFAGGQLREIFAPPDGRVTVQQLCQLDLMRNNCAAFQPTALQSQRFRQQAKQIHLLMNGRIHVRNLLHFFPLHQLINLSVKCCMQDGFFDLSAMMPLILLSSSKNIDFNFEPVPDDFWKPLQYFQGASTWCLTTLSHTSTVAFELLCRCHWQTYTS